MDINPGKAVIFKNDKEGNEKRPDYRGELKTPGGEHLRIALWISESKAGNKYFSGKVQALEQESPQQEVPADTDGLSTDEARAAADAAKTGNPDDDIPF